MPNRHINARAKNLRKRLTETEYRLWGRLRAKQIGDLKFRRQAPIGSYIVDFVCHEKRIIIEVDGGQHSLNRDRDAQREKWFHEQGYRILRFWNHEVLTNMDGVLEIIRGTCLNHPPLTPPIKGGEVREKNAGEPTLNTEEPRIY